MTRAALPINSKLRNSLRLLRVDPKQRKDRHDLASASAVPAAVRRRVRAPGAALRDSAPPLCAASVAAVCDPPVYAETGVRDPRAPVRGDRDGRRAAGRRNSAPGSADSAARLGIRRLGSVADDVGIFESRSFAETRRRTVLGF